MCVVRDRSPRNVNDKDDKLPKKGFIETLGQGVEEVQKELSVEKSLGKGQVTQRR